MFDTDIFVLQRLGHPAFVGTEGERQVVPVFQIVQVCDGGRTDLGGEVVWVAERKRFRNFIVTNTCSCDNRIYARC